MIFSGKLIGGYFDVWINTHLVLYKYLQQWEGVRRAEEVPMFIIMKELDAQCNSSLMCF